MSTQSAIPEVRGSEIPIHFLESSLVESGGRAWLAANRNLPQTDMHAVLSMELSPWAESFGGFRICLTGRSFAVSVNETAIFADAVSNTLIQWDVTPGDLDFLPNAFTTQWYDGRAAITRADLYVNPATKKQSLIGDNREWCYRYVVGATNNSAVSLTIQALPAPLHTVLASPWGDTMHVASQTRDKVRGSFPTIDR